MQFFNKQPATRQFDARFSSGKTLEMTLDSVARTGWLWWRTSLFTPWINGGYTRHGHWKEHTCTSTWVTRRLWGTLVLRSKNPVNNSESHRRHLAYTACCTQNLTFWHVYWSTPWNWSGFLISIVNGKTKEEKKTEYTQDLNGQNIRICSRSIRHPCTHAFVYVNWLSFNDQIWSSSFLNEIFSIFFCFIYFMWGIWFW